MNQPNFPRAYSDHTLRDWGTLVAVFPGVDVYCFRRALRVVFEATTTSGFQFDRFQPLFGDWMYDTFTEQHPSYEEVTAFVRTYCALTQS